MVERLSAFQWVIVRIGCNLCNRSGTYRLARLSAKFGTEISLEELLDKLALDCLWRRQPWQRTARKYQPKCGAHFVDLERAPTPPDLPPSMRRLRLVQGGKD
jgi:hypothetical protein